MHAVNNQIVATPINTPEFIAAGASTETKTKPLRAPRGIGQRKHRVEKRDRVEVPVKTYVKYEWLIPLERLKKLLDYNPETMLFTWRQSWGGGIAGRVAGSSTIYGHVNITINTCVYWASDLVEYWTTGLYTHHLPSAGYSKMYYAFVAARELEETTREQLKKATDKITTTPPKQNENICLGPRLYVRTKYILDNLYDDDFTEYDENH